MLIVHEGKGDLEKSGGRTVCSILRLRMNDVSDGTALNEEGRAFQARAAAMGNVRSPSVVRRVDGTTRVFVTADRRCVDMSEVSWSVSANTIL